MLKFYKVFILFLFLVNFSFAQSPLEIYDLAGNKIESGTKLYSYVDGGSSKVLFTDSLKVKSIYTDLVKIKVRKTEKTIINGTSNSFSALSQTVPSSENITPSFVSLNPGETLADAKSFIGTYSHRGLKGTSIIYYSFLAYNISNELIDSVYVEYFFKNASVIFLDENNQIFPRGEVLVTGDPDEVVNFPVIIYNQHTQNINLQVEKSVLFSEDNHEVYFRFGNIEYAPEENESSLDGVEVTSRDTLIGDNQFEALFNANGTDSNTELTKVRYLFHDLVNVADSNSITLVFNPSGVGFEELNKYQISAPYPNPANDMFTIDHSNIQSSKAEIKIYNLRGQLLFAKEINTSDISTTISVDVLTSGTYFISLEIDGQPKGVEKLIIQ